MLELRNLRSRWSRVWPSVFTLMLALVVRVELQGQGLNLPDFTTATDGELCPTCPGAAPMTMPIDLSLASTGDWNGQSFGNHGIYDPSKWAVVFKYSSVNIPAGVTVTFRNHSDSFPPVVWLVDGNVTIGGAINIGGSGGSSAIASPGGTSPVLSIPTPGPGGFRGGCPRIDDADAPGGARQGSNGLGPGGGAAGCPGSYGTQQPCGGSTYGNQYIVPLIGGSGGSQLVDSGTGRFFTGGAGGGAILIVASGTITLLSTCAILANGGNGSAVTVSGSFIVGSGPGSGGAVRFICNDFVAQPSAILSAMGGERAASFGGVIRGGDGRIYVGANTCSISGVVAVPNIVQGTPGMLPGEALIWPPASAPTVEIVEIAGVSAPSDPEGGLMHMTSSMVDVHTALESGLPFVVDIQGRNLPVTWAVNLRIVHRNSASATANPVTQVIPAPFYSQPDPFTRIYRATVSTGIPDNTVFAFQAIAAGP